MTHAYRKTEFWLAIGLLYYYFKLPFIVNGVVGFYILAQILRKKNRGQFYTGLFTSEFWMTLFILVYNWYFKLPWYFIVSNYGLYAVARGLTHGVGVKTQTLIKV